MQQSELLTLGIGLISVPSSCSILNREKRLKQKNYNTENW